MTGSEIVETITLTDIGNGRTSQGRLGRRQLRGRHASDRHWVGELRRVRLPDRLDETAEDSSRAVLSASRRRALTARRNPDMLRSGRVTSPAAFEGRHGRHHRHGRSPSSLSPRRLAFPPSLPSASRLRHPTRPWRADCHRRCRRRRHGRRGLPRLPYRDRRRRGRDRAELHGIVGAPIARDLAFAYSPAMAAFGTAGGLDLRVPRPVPDQPVPWPSSARAWGRRHHRSGRARHVIARLRQQADAGVPIPALLPRRTMQRGPCSRATRPILASSSARNAPTVDGPTGGGMEELASPLKGPQFQAIRAGGR